MDADISFEIELRIQERTMLLLLIQELRSFESFSLGFSIDPSMKPNLFLTDKAITIARFHDA